MGRLPGALFARPQSIEVISPRLHHLPPLGQALGTVVGGSYFVSLFMRKLQLY